MSQGSARKTLLLGFVLIAVIGAVGGYWLYAKYRIAPEPALASLPLETLDGSPVAAAEWLGQPVLVSFWQTWCPPCRAEMPTLASLQEELTGVGLRVVLISDEPSAKLQQFSSIVPASLQQYRVPSLAELDVFTYPTNVLYNGAGEVVYKTTGVINKDAEELRELLRPR